ncbi:MAG: Na+/H+ antiporter NhaA [Pseudohongiellaceae bacterium]
MPDSGISTKFFRTVRRRKNGILPAVGAVGGILIPGRIYAWLNRGDSAAMQGWAIPTATDIPLSVKVFLTSLAIFDDVAAILIIAFFYSSASKMVFSRSAGLRFAWA